MLVPSERERPPLVPPFRFATVEDGVYRGAYPTLANFRFLRRLRLRTIVSLLSEQASTDLRQFCEGEQIEHRFLPIEKSEPAGLKLASLVEVVKLMMVAKNLPMYVHCMDGFVTTGVVVMCMRKLQLWTSAVAQIEFSRFSRVRGEQPAPPAPAHSQLIDAFTADESFCTFVDQHKLEKTLSEWCTCVTLFAMLPSTQVRTASVQTALIIASNRRATEAAANGVSSVLQSLSLEGYDDGKSKLAARQWRL